jgi:hypothetical protein
VSLPPHFRPLDLRLAPEYRRSAVYPAVGLAAAAGLVVWLKLAGLNPQSWEVIAAAGGAFAGGAAGLLAVVFRYRLRIDAHGVWRRRLVRWDLWPWEAFEGGRVRHGVLRDQFIYAEKSWFWRTISASVLGAADQTAFEAAVARFWVAPPPPELPGLVAVTYGLGARLELSADGVRLLAPQRDAGESLRWQDAGDLVRWPDVVRAEVVRVSHDRRDFWTLTLHVPGRAAPVRLSRGQGRPNWSGADAEMIALFLRRHLDDGRFEVTVFRGPPTGAAEADRRLALLDKAEQELRKVGRYCGYIFVGGTLFLTVAISEVWNRPNPLNWGRQNWEATGIAFGGSVVVQGLILWMHLGVAYFGRRDLRLQREDVLRWKADRARAI